MRFIDCTRVDDSDLAEAVRILSDEVYELSESILLLALRDSA